MENVKKVEKIEEIVKEVELKNLTLTEMKKQIKKLDEKIEGEVNMNGVPYKIKVDKVFKKTKQYTLLNDLIKFLNLGIENHEFLELSSPYISLLLIKHFTSVDVSDDIDKALELLDLLIDLDLFGQILDLLPEEQVIDVNNVLEKSMEKMTENINEVIRELEDSKDSIQNQELKDLL